MTDSAAHIRVLALMRSEETRSELTEAWKGMNGHTIEVEVGALGSALPATGPGARRDVLLIDVDPRRPDEIEALDRLLGDQRQAVPVVVTAPEPTGEHIRTLMRRGVVDVLPQPIQRGDLLDALGQAARRIASAAADTPAPGGQIVTFIKGGGGVGATTLAVQCGCLLARAAGPEDPGTSLIDLDFQFGTAALSLDLAAKSTLADLLDRPERLDGAIVGHVMTRHDSGLEVLAPPGEVMPLDSVSPELVMRLLKLARAEYRHVLVDLPGCWTNWTYACLAESDLIVLVTELTVTAIQQSIRQLETLRLHDLGNKPLKLVLNKREAPSRLLGVPLGSPASLEQAEKALGRPFDFTVASDFATVSEAINQGLPTAEVVRKARVNKDIAAMLEGIRRELARLDPAAASAPAKPRRKGWGLIGHVLATD